MAVTKFSESNALSINRKIIPKATDADKKIKPTKIFSVRVMVRNRMIKNDRS